MIEKVICCCGDDNQSSKALEINSSDSFKLVYQFVDDRFDPPTLKPLMAFDLEFKYYVKGREASFVASKSGLNGTNCKLDFDRSIVKVIFDNTSLGKGFLYCKMTYKFPDTDYPNGYRTEVVDRFTGIKLV